MTTLDGDNKSPNGMMNVFDVTMDDDCAAAAASGCVRLVHIHKNDDEPMVIVYDSHTAAPVCNLLRKPVCDAEYGN